MKRMASALGWSLAGLVIGAIIGAVAGFLMGALRSEDVLRAALAGAGPVGLVGALGAFCGSLLERSKADSDSLTVVTVFLGAIVGALTGAIIGKALGADIWLLESVAQVESASVQAFLLYHIDLFGGPHVVVGALLGILAFGSLDVFHSSDSSFNALIIAFLLIPVLAIIAALFGQIDWGAAIAIVVATVAILYIFGKSGGESSSTGVTGGNSAGAKSSGNTVGAKAKGKGKPKA